MGGIGAGSGASTGSGAGGVGVGAGGTGDSTGTISGVLGATGLVVVEVSITTGGVPDATTSGVIIGAIICTGGTMIVFITLVASVDVAVFAFFTARAIQLNRIS